MNTHRAPYRVAFDTARERWELWCFSTLMCSSSHRDTVERLRLHNATLYINDLRYWGLLVT